MGTSDDAKNPQINSSTNALLDRFGGQVAAPQGNVSVSGLNASVMKKPAPKRVAVTTGVGADDSDDDPVGRIPQPPSRTQTQAPKTRTVEIKSG